MPTDVLSSSTEPLVIGSLTLNTVLVFSFSFLFAFFLFARGDGTTARFSGTPLFEALLTLGP